MVITKNIVSAGVVYDCGISRADIQDLKGLLRRDQLESHLDIRSDASVSVPRHFDDSSAWKSDAEISFWSNSKSDLTNFLSYLKYSNAITNITCGMRIYFKLENTPKALAVFSSCVVRRDFKRDYLKFAKSKIHDYDLKMFLNMHLNTNCTQNLLVKQLAANPKYSYAAYTQISLASFYKTGAIEVKGIPAMRYPEDKIVMNWVIREVSELYNKYKNNKKILANYKKLVSKIEKITPRGIPGWVSKHRVSPLATKDTY